MARESLKKKRSRAEELIRLLEEEYGEPECSLLFRENPWRLLVAAILAAQCTDARVNLVTPALFARFPEPGDFALSSPEEIEPYIKSCGLFRNKAKSIHAAAVYCTERFGGELPRDFEEILAIPGVGRKIANLLIGDCFGMPGIVVDTHCKRLSRRLGLTDTEDPTKAERELLKLIPEEKQIAYGHLMVTHGRECCKAQHPLCGSCILEVLCPYPGSMKKTRA